MSESYKSDGKIVVMVFSQTAPIYPRGSCGKENQRKARTIEDINIGSNDDIDFLYLKKFLNSSFEGRVEIINKSNTTFKETEDIIKKNVQSTTEDEYDCFGFVFLTYVDNKGRLQFYCNEDDFQLLEKDLQPLEKDLQPLEKDLQPLEKDLQPLEKDLQPLERDLQLLEKHFQPLEKIIDMVKDIPVTRGKPKIFLVQSDDMTLDEPITLTKGPELLPAIVQVKIPADADRLVIQSTIPQKLAGEKKESFLIQAFVDALTENNASPIERRDDLLSLTTVINKKVADLIDPLTENRKKEGKADLPVPLTTSTLTKLLFF